MRVAVLFVLIYTAFDRSAALLGSSRGQWGGLVCAVVVALCVIVEWAVSGAQPPAV